MYLLGEQVQGGAAEKEAARALFFQAICDQKDRNSLVGDGFDICLDILETRQPRKSGEFAVTVERFFRLGMRSLYGR